MGGCASLGSHGGSTRLHRWQRGGWPLPIASTGGLGGHLGGCGGPGGRPRRRPGLWVAVGAVRRGSGRFAGGRGFGWKVPVVSACDCVQACVQALERLRSRVVEQHLQHGDRDLSGSGCCVRCYGFVGCPRTAPREPTSWRRLGVVTRRPTQWRRSIPMASRWRPPSICAARPS